MSDNAARDVAIRFLYGNGVPMKEIGAHYGLGRARISQIVRGWRQPPRLPSRRGLPPLTPSQRRTRARIGAYSLHAQGKTSTAAATVAQLKRFDTAENPEAALRAYMTTLALRGVRAKAAKRRQ